MKIGKREIGEDEPPYFIAEIGANHGGYLDRALRMIDAAKGAGADAVKFQAYTADTITIDSDREEFMLKEGPWKGRRLYDLYKQCQTPFEWFPAIAEHAQKCGITWFASAFDQSAVDVLHKLGCPAIKIASFEIVDTPLISYAARTGLPLIISTGMASGIEIYHALANVYRHNTALLHCVSAYPTPIEEANLKHLKKMLTYESLKVGIVGISDHTLGVEIPIAATAIGATIIEKHFTLNRTGHRTRDPDDAFSSEPLEFRKMVDACTSVWKAIQGGESESERAQQPLRRSLYVVKDIAAGEAFTMENVRSIRPGAGLPPSFLPSVLTQRAACDIKGGTPLSGDLLG